MKVQIKHVTIEIEELGMSSLLRFNPEGQDNNYVWRHYSGLGFIEPKSGVGSTIKDCIGEATEAINRAFPG